MRFTSKTILAGLLGSAISLSGLPALAQQTIDEPDLSPMFFGKSAKDNRDKVVKEQASQEKAVRISQPQDENLQDLDEPKLDPLLFGPDYEEPAQEDDPTGSRITLGEKDDNRGFFGVLTFLVPNETNLSIGVGPEYEPDYFGSDDYHFTADPQVYVKFKNFVFLDDDGADFALFGFSGFRIGPSLRIKARRDQDDNIALRGLGDVGTTVEFGGFAATTFNDRFAFKAKVRKGLNSRGHNGLIVDGYLTALLFRAGPISMSTSAQTSWIGNNYADAFFSVTPQQSAASDGILSVYNADAGFRDVGASINGYINILDRWSLNPYATYTYIFDDYANTPIIKNFGDRNQFRVGFHIMREFTFSGI